MDVKIIEQFKKIYEKQDILSSLHNKDLFLDLDISEVHSLDIIGSYKDVNGIRIANKMGMTRGGASKLLNKLLFKGYVSKYKKEDNKKEIYFSLTNKGEEIYTLHKKAHEDWKKRDSDFLKTILDNDKKVISEFLGKFDDYLKNRIEEIENDN